MIRQLLKGLLYGATAIICIIKAILMFVVALAMIAIVAVIVLLLFSLL